MIPISEAHFKLRNKLLPSTALLPSQPYCYSSSRVVIKQPAIKQLLGETVKLPQVIPYL